MPAWASPAGSASCNGSCRITGPRPKLLRRSGSVIVRCGSGWLAIAPKAKRGCGDRSSRPRRSPRQLPPALERRIARLRAQRRTGLQIADTLRLPLSTVGDVLRRLGLGRLPPLVSRPPIVRYERATPGELLHIDVKK